MRGRRGSRSAAVVLAGCVGLAVMAPGMALAAGPADYTSETTCEDAGYTWDTSAATPVCTSAATTSTTSDPVTSDPAPSETTTPSASSTAPAAGSAPSAGVTDQSSTGGGASSAAGQDSTDATSTGTDTGSGTPVARVASAQAVEDGNAQLQDAIAEELPTDVTALIPIALPTGLPFEVPTSIPAGGFTNPQEACGFFVSQLGAATPEQAAALGQAAAAFCSSLPTSFTGFDPTDLVQDLIDIIQGLIPALPTPPATIPTQAPSTVPAAYWGYWSHQYDVDCPDLTYAEANAILAGDPSDPFRLDGDNDGVACEENARGNGVAYVQYDSYPTGGVATGDGSTETGASGVEVALAAATLAGLGVTGLVLVRRFARQG